MTGDQSSQNVHALYRFYSDGGQLLYVGITNNPGNRFSQHQADKPWWHDVAGISVEKFPSRADALAAEARAIAVERPLHNIQRPSIGRRRDHASSHRPTRTLVWLCDVCGDPVSGGKGYIHVDTVAAYKVRHAWQEWEAERRTKHGFLAFSLAEADGLPHAVRWETHHRDCDPSPERDGDYWFDVARARTHAHLLDWSAHLMRKKWISDTNWDDFIRRAAAVDA